MKKLLFVFASLLLAQAVVYSGGRTDKSKYPNGEYDIAYSGILCGSPIALASILGYYEEEGVKINLVSGSTFEAQREMLASGKMPIINGDFQFFPAIANGINVKLISGLHEGCIKVLVPNSSSIKSVRDLKNKTIIVDEIGGTPMSVASVSLGNVGIDPQTEVSWKPFPWDQLIQALEKGEGDAVAVWDPFGTMAELTGKYRTLVDIATDPLFAGKNCCFIFASGKLIKDNPKAIAAVLRAIQRAVEYTGANPKETTELLIKNKSIAIDDVELVTTMLSSYHYDKHHSLPTIAKAKDDALFFAKELIKINYLPKNLDPQKFIDDMFVDLSALLH